MKASHGFGITIEQSVNLEAFGVESNFNVFIVAII